MHIGEEIRRKMEERGKSVTWLAEQLPCERSNVYNIFRRQNIGIDLLLRISILLEHDFFQSLSEEYLNSRQSGKVAS